MLHSTYMSTRPIVMALAQEKNTSSAPQISTHANARTCTPTCRLIALTGVFLVGFTFPTIFGSTPDRRVAGLALGVGGDAAGHELDDVVELLVAGQGPEHLGELRLHVVGDGQVER